MCCHRPHFKVVFNTSQRSSWQSSSLEAKAENGRRARLHFQQTSILFHGNAIKQSCQGNISLGAFQEQSASSCGVFLLPDDQYLSHGSPISVQEQGDGFTPGIFRGISKVVVVTCWITTMGTRGFGFSLCHWDLAQGRVPELER